MFSLITPHIRPYVFRFIDGIESFPVASANKTPPTLENISKGKTIPESQKEQIKNSISANLHGLESEVTSKKISTILKGKFDSLGLSFDVTQFEKTLQNALSSVMKNPTMPFIAKRKFLEDVNSKVTLLSNITLADIENLKTQRNVMSLGVEAMELSGKTEKEKQAFYLNKILTETIGKYITPTALGLVEAFSGYQTRIGEVSYQKKSLDAYSTSIVGLDAKYGLSMKGVLDRMHRNSAEKKSDLMTDGISREMRNTIISDLAQRYPTFAAKPSIQTVLATLKMNPSFQIRYTPDMVVDISGQKITLRDIIDDYRKVNATWQGGEHEIRDARDTTLADGTIAKMKNKFGMDQLRSEFDHLSPENIEAKMKNASLADMIIMATQLAQIMPIVGDIGGGSLDIAGAITGISTDGAKMSTVERSLSGLFGALGITVFGGWLNRARKTKKLAGLTKVLPLMQKYMPEKIETFVKGGGKIGKDTLEKILRFTKDVGVPIPQKISEIFPNTTRILTKPKKQVLPKIQPGIILGNIELLQEVEKYSMDVCSALGISKNSEKYKIISSDINVLLNASSHNIEYNVMSYKGILKLNPKFSLGKGEIVNHSFILNVYLKLLHNNKIKELLIHQSDNKVIFRMINDIGFLIPDNKEDFQLLFKVFEDFPDQNISSRIEALDIFSSGSNAISNEEKYKIAHGLLIKGVDEKLLQGLYSSYLDYSNLIYDEGLKLRNIIGNEKKSKSEIENAIHDFYKILEERKQSRNLDSVQIPAGDPWDMVNLNELRDAAQRNPLFDRFSGLLSFKEKFDPKTGLEHIKKLSPIEKQKAMKVWREKLKEQLDIMASFPSDIKKYINFLERDPTDHTSEDVINKIIIEFTPKLKELSLEQRQQVMTGIEKYVNKVFIVDKYANDPKYINNSKQLIADAFGVDISKLKGDVTMDINGANFTFYVHQEDDYKLLHAYGDEEKAKNLSSSGGFASSWAKIPELRGTISVCNGRKEGNTYAEIVQLHETKHMDNKILMPDHGNGDKLTRGKDEIIAYLTDGRSIEEIKKTLFKTGDGALYDYYKSIKENDPERYKKLRILYEKELDIAINIAERLKESSMPNYIDILAITPVRQWGKLEKIYLNPNLSEAQKMEKNIRQIFEKIYETSRAVKADTSKITESPVFIVALSSAMIAGGIITVSHYLNEYYPDWSSDLRNNAKKFYEKMNELLNVSKIKSFLDKYP